MDHFERPGLRFAVSDSLDLDGSEVEQRLGAAPGDSPSDAAPTVVLLHGFPQQPSAFNTVGSLLREHGLRTLIPTQRGYTAAARPKRRRDYRTSETVRDVVALLDAAGVAKAHLVGHDWGGTQAWAVAAWHPDRVASLTVLSTPHPAAMVQSLATSTQALRSGYMALFQLPLLPEAFAFATLGKMLRNSGLPLTYIGRYCDAMAEWGAFTGALNWYRGMPFSLRPIGPVTVPTTYVWGRHDVALGRAAAEGTAVYVHAPYEFREIDAGHWLPEVAPAAVAMAVLDRVAATEQAARAKEA